MSTEVHISRANELNVEAEARIYRTLRHFWHPVAYAADLVHSPIGFALCGRDIVVVRMEGDVVAFDDLCAHRGTKLSLGQVLDNCLLECRYHGWRYDKNGDCVIVPQRPDLASRLKARVRKYPAEERFGMIWVALVDEPHFPLPDYPQWNEPEYHHVAVPSVDWDCTAPRRVENYTDYSHFPILHDKTLGDRTQPEVPPHEVWREANRLENRQGAGSWSRSARRSCPRISPRRYTSRESTHSRSTTGAGCWRSRMSSKVNTSHRPRRCAKQFERRIAAPLFRAYEFCT